MQSVQVWKLFFSWKVKQHVRDEYELPEDMCSFIHDESRSPDGALRTQRQLYPEVMDDPRHIQLVAAGLRIPGKGLKLIV